MTSVREYLHTQRHKSSSLLGGNSSRYIVQPSFSWFSPLCALCWTAFYSVWNLQKMRAEAEGEQPVFDSLEAELKKATAVSDKMSRVHSERDAELDHYRQLLSSLQDRWKAVFSQVDLRQRELEQLGRQLGYYRESYDWLIRWINDAKQRQEKIQAVTITDSKTLKEQLTQEKVCCVPFDMTTIVFINLTQNESTLFFLLLRNCWRRLRATKTKLMSVKNMLKHTLIPLRSALNNTSLHWLLLIF